MDTFITFTDEAGATFTFSGNTVLVFIDETGHELLKDKNYPVFGLGGCACLAKDYLALIYEPWKQVESVFEPSQLPLHATDLPKHKMTNVHFDAINHFFADNAFARFACLVTNQTANSSEADFFTIAVANVHERIRRVIQWLPFDQIVMLLESSERTAQRLTHHFNQYTPEIKGVKVPMHHFFVDKKANEPGIAVADFVIQTAGSTVASKGKHKIANYTDRRDFQNVFCSMSDQFVSFIEINSIAPSPAATRNI